MPQGNFVSEWFGYRTFPLVHDDPLAKQAQGRSCCPFLSKATGVEKQCVKARSSSGVCTINNASNGARQDWLVCPFRALDEGLLEAVVLRSFGLRPPQPFVIRPATILARPAARDEVLAALARGSLVVVYLQNKLGGEISLRSTRRSPELSFDITFAELLPADEATRIGRFGVLEVQTMDFHGSYRHAVQNLTDALRLHGTEFPRVLQQNQHWLAERIEGPNIANVFKRTFYQMMLKFQLGLHPRAVATSLALPEAVWDSWQPHLGRPDLVRRSDGTFTLQALRSADGDQPKAWIHVFDLDGAAALHPSPVVVRKSILTDAGTIARYALEDVPRRAFAEEDGAGAGMAQAILRRLSAIWPGVVL